jgi:hypothetical protein
MDWLHSLIHSVTSFLRKFVGVAGSYFNDSHTAVAKSSDYAFIENNRVIDKAIRGVYASVLPDLNGPLELNANGTLSDVTVEYLTGKAELPLEQMDRNGELSAYLVTIDPSQNVQSAGKLVIGVKLVALGVARNITVNIGFTSGI